MRFEYEMSNVLLKEKYENEMLSFLLKKCKQMQDHMIQQSIASASTVKQFDNINFVTKTIMDTCMFLLN